MKKDNLERFVRDNREAFDDREPPNGLWQKVEQGLDQQSAQTDSNPNAPFRQIHKQASRSTNRPIGLLDWRVAASITLLLLAGGFWYANHRYGVTHQPEVVAASPTHAKAVVEYTRLIDGKRDELRQLTEGNPALYQEFAQDLDRLERSYQSLKAALPTNPNQEVLIQAMIQNLQLQIDLLNEQLRVIERIKQQTHENPV